MFEGVNPNARGNTLASPDRPTSLRPILIAKLSLLLECCLEGVDSADYIAGEMSESSPADFDDLHETSFVRNGTPFAALSTTIVTKELSATVVCCSMFRRGAVGLQSTACRGQNGHESEFRGFRIDQPFK